MVLNLLQVSNYLNPYGLCGVTRIRLEGYLDAVGYTVGDRCTRSTCDFHTDQT